LFGDYLAHHCSVDCRDDDCSTIDVDLDWRSKSIRHNMESNEDDATPVITFQDCSLEDLVLRMFQRLYPGSRQHHVVAKISHQHIF
jgi:hypothetical protein